MSTEQVVKSEHAFGGGLLDAFNIYAQLMVSYVAAVVFVFFGVSFAVSARASVPVEIKLIFFGTTFLVLFISCGIRRSAIVRKKPLKIVILLGNVFGFLFSLIYASVKAGSYYGREITFGGVEKFVFFTERADDLNMIEIVYAFLGAMLFTALLSMVAVYGLSLKDKFKREGSKLKVVFSFIMTIFAGLCLFMFIMIYQNVFEFIAHLVTGSLLFIYGINLFKRSATFLKF